MGTEAQARLISPTHAAAAISSTRKLRRAPFPLATLFHMPIFPRGGPKSHRLVSARWKNDAIPRLGSKGNDFGLHGEVLANTTP